MELLALIVVGAINNNLVQKIREFISNENSPELNQTALLIRKRRHTTNTGGTVSTTYTAEFELKETGERIRCHVPRRVWKALEEETLGQLTHQGTRFRRFAWKGQSVET